MTKRPIILALALGAACAPACAAGSDTDSSSAGTPPPPRLIATKGVTIKEIALYQAVKRPLMVAGMPATSETPIVAGRDALLRVFVDVEGGAEVDAGADAGPSREVIARVYLDEDPAPIEIKQAIAASSTDAKLDSTLNFDIPGAKLTPTTKYRVTVGELEVAPTGALDAPAYPATGTDPIPAESSGETLKIVLAPISYKGVVPKLTEELIKQYSDAFYAMYPTPKLELTVRAEPIVWTKTVDPNGFGWSELLEHVADVRMQDKVGKDVYYYAPLTPTASVGQFCGGGCVAGLGLLGGSGDSYARAAIGLAYGDPNSLVTALHETAHNHGRSHAPCGLNDADPKYPHDGGKTAVWGNDLVTKELFQPTRTDVMGYCPNIWVSDYTFKGLFDRMKLVNAAQRVIAPEAERNRVYDRAIVGADGTVKWLSSIRLEEPPAAEEKSIEVESAGLTETVKGSFYRFDHLEGGIAFWPASERRTTAIRIGVAAGKTVRLPR